MPKDSYSRLKNGDVEINLRDILEISISDTLILQNLLINPDIKRITLHDNINSYFGDLQEDKDLIPTSSFYQKMDRLEKKGLIITAKTDNGKVSTIRATPLAQNLLDFVLKLNVFGSMNFISKLQELIPNILQSTGPEKMNKLLIIISFPEAIDHKMINFLSDNAVNTFILADDITYQRYISRGLNIEVKQTNIIDGTIRDADNFYDAVIVVGYKPDYNLYGNLSLEWLKEGYRVLGEGGRFFVTALDLWPKIDHLVLGEFLNKLNDNKFMAVISGKNLIKDIEYSGLENPELIEQNGILIAWGEK